MAFADAGAEPLVVLEKTATAGGTWRHFGNAFSRVNSSEYAASPAPHQQAPPLVVASLLSA